MRFVYNEDLTKDIMKKYFKTNEDIDGEVEIECGVRKIPAIGLFFVESEAPTVSFTIKGIMDIGGDKQPVEVPFGEEEINDAFTQLLEASGRKVRRVVMNFDEKKFNYVAVEAGTKRMVKKYGKS